MRRLTSIFLALLLAGVLCTSVLAAGSAEIVRAFVCDGTLYTYIAMEGIEKPVTKAEARLGGQTFPSSDRLETVRQAGAPVTWLLLVDNSTSMPAFRQETEDFAQSLVQSGGENTRFILATFGDAFTVRAEDVSPEELSGEVEKIPFDERVTRLHTAIDQGLDYFEGLPRQRSELRCMVVLSDGVQYDPAGGVPYEELLERVGASDVMLHSVGLGGDQEALESMGRLAEASGGIHQVIGGVTAAAAGTVLAEDSGKLFVTGFDLSGLTTEGGTERVSVIFAAGSELVCRAEAQVELPEFTGKEGTGADVQPPDPLPESPAQWNRRWFRIPGRFSGRAAGGAADWGDRRRRVGDDCGGGAPDQRETESPGGLRFYTAGAGGHLYAPGAGAGSAGRWTEPAGAGIAG